MPFDVSCLAFWTPVGLNPVSGRPTEHAELEELDNYMSKSWIKAWRDAEILKSSETFPTFENKKKQTKKLWINCYGHLVSICIKQTICFDCWVVDVLVGCLLSSLSVLGVSSRPLQMAKQEPMERRTADKLHTHPCHYWWPHWNNSGEAEMACSRESSKAAEGLLPYWLVGHSVSLSCQRWEPFLLNVTY